MEETLTLSRGILHLFNFFLTLKRHLFLHFLDIKRSIELLDKLQKSKFFGYRRIFGKN